MKKTRVKISKANTHDAIRDFYDLMQNVRKVQAFAYTFRALLKPEDKKSG